MILNLDQHPELHRVLFPSHERKEEGSRIEDENSIIFKGMNRYFHERVGRLLTTVGLRLPLPDGVSRDKRDKVLEELKTINISKIDSFLSQLSKQEPSLFQYILDVLELNLGVEKELLVQGNNIIETKVFSSRFDIGLDLQKARNATIITLVNDLLGEDHKETVFSRRAKKRAEEYMKEKKIHFDARGWNVLDWSRELFALDQRPFVVDCLAQKIQAELMHILQTTQKIPSRSYDLGPKLRNPQTGVSITPIVSQISELESEFRAIMPESRVKVDVIKRKIQTSTICILGLGDTAFELQITDRDGVHPLSVLPRKTITDDSGKKHWKEVGEKVACDSLWSAFRTMGISSMINEDSLNESLEASVNQGSETPMDILHQTMKSKGLSVA